MNIIFWLIASFFAAIWSSFRKKAIDNSTLHNWLITLFWPAIGLVFIYLLVFIFWINSNIFYDNKVIILLLVWWFIDWIAALIEVSIFKRVKVSKILPYWSFDKLFIILLWFILFYWNPWYTSIITLLISILTVVIIMLFSIDYKNFWIERDVKLYIFVKFLYACTTLIMWRILFEYSTLDIFSVIIFIYLGFHLFSNIIFRRNFKSLLTQSKQFYKYRVTSSILWRISFVLSIIIIEKSWVLIASLLSFITIVFSIFSMKFILWDSPTKKQILLALLVVVLIWTWYYFK